MLMRLSMMAPGTQTLRLPRLWVLIRPVVAQHSAAGRHQQALLAYYRALSLDAGLVSAAKNALVALNRWARTFADADNYERAIALLDIGLTLAPIDRSIRHNRRVVWQQRVSHTARDGSPEQVLAKAGQWADAIAITAPASERVNEVSLRSLKRFQVSVFSRWLMAAIDATQWPEALKAVSKAKTYLPADNRMRRNAAYPLQEWSEHAVAHQDTGAGVEAARSVLDVYPDAHQVKRAARGFVGRRLQALGKHADLAPALDLAKQSIVLLPACHDQQEMLATVVNTQVRQHIDARRW